MILGVLFGYADSIRCGDFTLYYADVMLPNYSASKLDWITTITIFLKFGVGIPIGALVDRYGSRPVIAPFAALGVPSLGLLSLCRTYWQIILSESRL